jgi:DNA repair exonuclease SbcCD nuclease subunit
MFKFLHAADIHLDSPLKGLERYEGVPVEQIRHATRRALENLIQLALDERVQFVLIAGDLYDGDWRDYNTGLFFIKQMARLREADIKVVLIKGNHDAANRMTRTLDLPENVTVLKAAKPDSSELEDIGVVVHGQSFGTAAEERDLSKNYPHGRRGLFNIGLLHTCLTGADGHEPYAPCTLEGLLSKEYDYWALGHVHKREIRHHNPYVVFPGNLQGRKIKEEGAKGCELVTVLDGADASGPLAPTRGKAVKFLRLKLIAFGPFTGTSLDLAAGNHGLHIIYGPNEAGKSSALRALRQLLYGIEERSTDSFMHPYTSLRIGATLCHSDGSKFEFIRRKARISSLRGPDDATILEPNALERFLGGVDADAFSTLFGIDRKTLVTGGGEILKGRGQVGEAIFEASSGIVGIRNVRSELQGECDELFRPGGKKQKINGAIQAYHDAKTAIKRAQLSSDDWTRHDRALNTARESREKLEEALRQMSREHNRLTRIRDALPAVGRRKKLLADLELFRDAVLLPDDFGANVRDLLSSHSAAADQARQAEETLEQLGGQIEELVLPQGLLDHADEIEELHRKLGEIEKGRKDQPNLVQEKKDLEDHAREILKRLGKPADLENVEGLRLRADEPIWIQDLGNQYQGLLADCRNAREKLGDLKKRDQQTHIELANLPDLANPVELRRKLRQVQQHGTLEGELSDVQKTLQQAESQAAVDLARLPHWHDTLEVLEVLPVPAAETVDRFESDFSMLNTGISQSDGVRDAL